MRKDTLFLGSLLTLLGILFLLDNVGLLGGLDVWGLFWPFFLIFLGILILLNFLIHPTTDVKQLKIPVGDAERAKIQFDHGAGRLNVRAGGNQDELILGSFGGGVEFSHDIAEGQANIRLKMPQRWFPFLWIPGLSSSTMWNVKLKQDYPLIMTFNTGAGETNLDLSDLKVQKVVIKTGASSTKIRLPNNAGYTSLHIESGVASVDVHIPENVAARIKTDIGLASVNINRSRFPKRGNVYISDDYDSSENKVDINISSGISSISIN
jgi:hypothetical protein